jgi:hypothetical protein
MKWYRMPRCTTALYDCLLCSTEFYCCPLCPTFRHIIGCFWPLSRGKSMYAQKKLCTELCGNTRKITATGCVRSVPQNLFLVFCFSMSKHLCRRGAACCNCILTPPAATDFSSSSFLAPVLSCRLSLNSLKEPAHGMGYPSARRDRPELRNQLVRQRRALTFQARSRSARFLFTLSCEGKRVLGISFLFPSLHSHHRLLCLHAR